MKKKFNFLRLRDKAGTNVHFLFLTTLSTLLTVTSPPEDEQTDLGSPHYVHKMEKRGSMS